jgi:hypothetical protein
MIFVKQKALRPTVLWIFVVFTTKRVVQRLSNMGSPPLAAMFTLTVRSTA